jgi:tetratricopeptide (TPR) repeat protein
MKNVWCILIFLAGCIFTHAQIQPSNTRPVVNPIYNNLPVGKYAVGFKVINYTDESRVTKPVYNYSGTSEEADHYRKIKVHIWYPAKMNTGKGILTYGDYSYMQLLGKTDEMVNHEAKKTAQNSHRDLLQGLYGRITDTIWNKLTKTSLLARKEAASLNQKFPLLIGMLRPVSTSVTNEMLASNGYVVAMVVTPGGSYPLDYIAEVADLQHVIKELNRSGMVDAKRIGTFGFSGSGFVQVLLSMYDPRISALADMESGLFSESFWKYLSGSNLYNIRKLRIPFLHFFREAPYKEEKYNSEFERSIFSDRYLRLFKYPKLNHWDFATEGRISTTVLGTRSNGPAISTSFELMNHSLLQFFDAVVKRKQTAAEIYDKQRFLLSQDTLSSITHYASIKPPPDREEFAIMIEQQGITKSIAFARDVHKSDTAAEFLQRNSLLQLSGQFKRQKKIKEAVALTNFTIELFPGVPFIWLDLADLYEADGNIPEAIRCCEKIIELLKDVNGSPNSFDARIKNAALETLKQLKK